MTNGVTKSQTDRLAEFEKLLDDYENNIGINAVKYNPEVKLALSFTIEQIKTMTVQECAIFNLLLTQYSAFLQAQYNRQKVRAEYANRELDLIMSNEASKYGYGDDKNFVKYEFVKGKVIGANQAAKALYGIIKHASARMQELEQMSTKVSMIARAIYDVKMIKVKE